MIAWVMANRQAVMLVLFGCLAAAGMMHYLLHRIEKSEWLKARQFNVNYYAMVLEGARQELDALIAQRPHFTAHYAAQSFERLEFEGKIADAQTRADQDEAYHRDAVEAARLEKIEKVTQCVQLVVNVTYFVAGVSLAVLMVFALYMMAMDVVGPLWNEYVQPYLDRLS